MWKPLRGRLNEAYGLFKSLKSHENSVSGKQRRVSESVQIDVIRFSEKALGICRADCQRAINSPSNRSQQFNTHRNYNIPAKYDLEILGRENTRTCFRTTHALTISYSSPLSLHCLYLLLWLCSSIRLNCIFICVLFTFADDNNDRTHLELVRAYARFHANINNHQIDEMNFVSNFSRRCCDIVNVSRRLRVDFKCLFIMSIFVVNIVRVCVTFPRFS